MNIVTLNVQDVHHWLTYGSLSQHCQWLSLVRQTKLTKVHLKTRELVFTALHVMQTRYSEENSVFLSVSPSVCPSVTRVDCHKALKLCDSYKAVCSLTKQATDLSDPDRMQDQEVALQNREEWGIINQALLPSTNQ